MVVVAVVVVVLVVVFVVGLVVIIVVVVIIVGHRRLTLKFGQNLCCSVLVEPAPTHPGM